MPTVAGAVTFVIVEPEGFFPQWGNPVVGPLYIPHEQHRQAKKIGRTINVSAAVVAASSRWLDPGFGKVGHSFELQWMNATGQFVRLGNLQSNDSKLFSIEGIFTRRTGVFGINNFKIIPYSQGGTLQTSRYNWKLSLSVTFDIL